MLKSNLCKAALIVSIVLSGSAAGAAETAAMAKPASALTLQNLKNGTYQIPDLACGYTCVRLTGGEGASGGVNVVFGRAVLGKLTGAKIPTAVVHLAYRTAELGWLQELVFIQEQQGKLLQVAEYVLDDRDQLKDLGIAGGEVVVETTEADNFRLHTLNKATHIRLAQTRQGCVVEATEFVREPATGKYVAQKNLAPYLSELEDRVSRCWTPTRKDRGEHVVVAFIIEPSGSVADVHVSTSSEVATADQAALEAVEAAAPFPPLPDSDNKPLEVCLEFQANISAHD